MSPPSPKPVHLPGLPDSIAITGLSADSRRFQPGFLFAALSGTKVDGRAFIGEATRKGAAIILAAEGTTLDGDGPPIITDPDPRRRFSHLAAQFFAHQPRWIAAVTGTNGKTSTVDFTRQILTALGTKAASIGTLGVISPGRSGGNGLTTPDPETLYATLAELAGEGVTHAALEASSHGLAQCRLDGVRIKAALFTNLTRDHLDYHTDIESYAQAKLRLFSELLPEHGHAVVNADSELAERIVTLAARRGQEVMTYGRMGTELRLSDTKPTPSGQMLSLSIMGRACQISLPLAGGFQASNALAALGLAIAGGADPVDATQALETLKGVPGRLEKVAARRSGAPVYIDYAHTPDALETVLKALRPHVGEGGRLICVFGCGGDRDPGKRPEMGAVVARLADEAIVTDDNPRSENPAAIRRAILAACPAAAEIGDRGAAIRDAVHRLRAPDVLVVAGKGHERSQIIGATVLPFDDALESRRAAAEIDGGDV